MILASLLMPRRTHPTATLTSAPIAVLVLTLLFSQPSGDSTLVYVLAMIAYGVTMQPSGPEAELHVPSHTSSQARPRAIRL